MTLKKLLVTASLLLAPVFLLAQGRGLDPGKVLKPLSDEWPTYSGDYSGKRYSLLTQINRLTVKNLTLAWTVRLTAGSVDGGGARGGGGAHPHDGRDGTRAAGCHAGGDACGARARGAWNRRGAAC